MTGPAPDWVEQARRFVAGSGLADVLAGFDPTGSGTDSPADHSAECRWCPLCAGLAALHGRRPELVEGLADVLSTAAAALRAHAAGPPDAHSDNHAGAAPTGPAAEENVTAPTPRPGPVQRIDVA